MIVHVWRRAVEADCGAVVVATDSETVRDAIVTAGGEALMTRPDHVSGSDRVFEAVLAHDPAAKLDTIVNLQGDLPTLGAVPGPRLPGRAARGGGRYRHHRRRDHPRRGAHRSQCGESDRHAAPGSSALRALYFTRATAPYGDGPLFHHIGLYAYTRRALERFVSLPPSPLELRERLEQLRALEAGMRIHVGLVDTVPLGVDTPPDLERARELLQSRRH